MRTIAFALALLVFLFGVSFPAQSQIPGVTEYVVCISDSARKLRKASPNMDAEAVADFALQDCAFHQIPTKEWMVQRGSSPQTVDVEQKKMRDYLRQNLIARIKKGDP